MWQFTVLRGWEWQGEGIPPDIVYFSGKSFTEKILKSHFICFSSACTVVLKTALTFLVCTKGTVLPQSAGLYNWPEVSWLGASLGRIRSKHTHFPRNSGAVSRELLCGWENECTGHIHVSGPCARKKLELAIPPDQCSSFLCTSLTFLPCSVTVLTIPHPCVSAASRFWQQREGNEQSGVYRRENDLCTYPTSWGGACRQSLLHCSKADSKLLHFLWA